MDPSSRFSRLSADSKRYQSALQSRSETFMRFEEIDGDDDFQEDFLCPVCAESYDIISLCCHIEDEHPLEATNGVCPVCWLRVGVDMVAHITLQHRNIFKMQRKRRLRKNGSHSRISLLRRELREGNLQSLLGVSSCVLSSSSGTPDPLLPSFILPASDHLVTHPAKKTSEEKQIKCDKQSGVSSISKKEHKEKARRSEFVLGLLSSILLDELV